MRFLISLRTGKKRKIVVRAAKATRSAARGLWAFSRYLGANGTKTLEKPSRDCGFYSAPQVMTGNRAKISYPSHETTLCPGIGIDAGYRPWWRQTALWVHYGHIDTRKLQPPHGISAIARYCRYATRRIRLPLSLHLRRLGSPYQIPASL
jgi:hypothetical protein